MDTWKYKKNYISSHSFFPNHDFKIFINGSWKDSEEETKQRVGAIQEVVIIVFYIAGTKNGIANATTKQGGTASDFSTWDIQFTEEALREWFSEDTWESKTRYQVLGINEKASPEEINAAYRSMVRKWHPDLNPSPEAKDRFIYLTETKNLLLDTNKRARYDAGLFLQAQTDSEQKYITAYYPPKSCGVIQARVSLRQGPKPVVIKILNWEDIFDKDGRKLVTKWRNGEVAMYWIEEHNPVGWRKQKR